MTAVNTDTVRTSWTPPSQEKTDNDASDWILLIIGEEESLGTLVYIATDRYIIGCCDATACQQNSLDEEG
jgi:hypothetical protein